MILIGGKMGVFIYGAVYTWRSSSGHNVAGSGAGELTLERRPVIRYMEELRLGIAGGGTISPVSLKDCRDGESMLGCSSSYDRWCGGGRTAEISMEEGARSPLGGRLSMYWREMGLHRSSILQRMDIYL